MELIYFDSEVRKIGAGATITGELWFEYVVEEFVVLVQGSEYLDPAKIKKPRFDWCRYLVIILFGLALGLFVGYCMNYWGNDVNINYYDTCDCPGIK
jgi:hypothetical protein